MTSIQAIKIVKDVTPTLLIIFVQFVDSRPAEIKSWRLGRAGKFHSTTQQNRGTQQRSKAY